MSERNYQDDLRINPEALDLEWLHQPAKFMYYAEKAANARDRRDRCKERLEVVRAEMDRIVRTNPEAYGIAKVNNDIVAAAVVESKEFQDANKEYLDSRLESELVQAAVTAMEMRKGALENLVRLHGQSYFAGPREPRDLGAAYLESVQDGFKEAAREETRDIIRTRRKNRAAEQTTAEEV